MQAVVVRFKINTLRLQMASRIAALLQGSAANSERKKLEIGALQQPMSSEMCVGLIYRCDACSQLSSSAARVLRGYIFISVYIDQKTIAPNLRVIRREDDL